MHGLENILTHPREGEWKGRLLKSQFFSQKLEGGEWIHVVSEMIQCSCTWL